MTDDRQLHWQEITGAPAQPFDRRSARERYASLIVGQAGWAALLKYECVLALSQWVPGAPGLVLRRSLYPRLLGSCGRNVVFGHGDIVLGRGVNIGFNCEIFSGSRVIVGEETMLAAYVYLIGGDHTADDDSLAISEQRRVSRGVTIASGAWLGAGVKVLDGVQIGERVIGGAGAVVRRNLPDGVRAVGVPARVLPVKASLPSDGSG